jgi:type VI secretion system protein ImpA
VTTIDTEHYLADLTPDRPCGDNLEYDPAFVDMERLLQGKPEAQFGATIIAAEPPDWKLIKASALELAGRTRDLRVGVALAQALLHSEGLPGFAAGLTLVTGLIERQWAQLHPQLDPSDGDDPVMRVNILAGLCDASLTLNGLRDAPLAVAPAHGRFSLRDIEVANGELPPAGDQARPQAAAVQAAFMEMELPRLQALVVAAQIACEQLAAMEKALMRLVGAAKTLDLSALARLLARVRDLSAERLSQRPDATPPEAELPSATAALPGTAASAARPASGVGDSITTRAEVIKALGLILDYYRIHEPSSPVPLLLERARRLVPMGFLDIIRDLAPDHIAELQKIQGSLSE